MNDDRNTRRIEQAALLGRRVDGDRLVLADAVLAAALDGSRPLSAGERAALQASPLTLRRLRQLALDRRAAANDADWRGSRGMLRAASSAGPLAPVSDDGWWTLHLLGREGAWRLVLQLASGAPFAARLLAERAPVRVLDGAGQAILEGRLDADGEIEAVWPFGAPPAIHLQQSGAAFTVEPC